MTYLAFAIVSLALVWAILLAGQNEKVFDVVSTILGLLTLVVAFVAFGLCLERVINVLAAL